LNVCKHALTHMHTYTHSMTPKMARMQAGVSGLLGFRVMPLPQEGAYEYSHLATGMRFQVCMCVYLRV